MNFVLDFLAIEDNPRRFEILSRGMSLDGHNVTVSLPRSDMEWDISVIEEKLSKNSIKFHVIEVEPKEYDLAILAGSAPDTDKEVYFKDRGVGYLIELIQRRLQSHAPALPVKEPEELLFNVTLEDVGSSKISIIKLVRGQFGLGLREAKDFVENGNGSLAEEVSVEKAEDIIRRFTEAGAKVSMKPC